MMISNSVRRAAEAVAGGTLLAVSVLFARDTLDAASRRAQDMGIPVGSVAPAAEVERLDGTKVDLASYFGKQPVLIEFWASWCPNCKALEPQLKAAKARYGDRMKFLGVAVTVNQSAARVKQYVEEHKLPLEMLWDARGNAVDVYDVPATSFIVIVDRNGKIAYGGSGSGQKLDEAIRKVLP